MTISIMEGSRTLAEEQGNERVFQWEGWPPCRRTETTRSVFPGDGEEKLHRKAGAHEQSKSTREQKW